MTKAEFARHRNVSAGRVSQWIAAGRLVLTDEGRVDVAASEEKLGRTGTRTQHIKLSAPRGPDPHREIASDGLRDARTRREVALADMAEMETALAARELVRARDMRAFVESLIGGLVASLDTLPARVGSTFAARFKCSASEATQLLAAEIRVLRTAALAECQRTLAPTSKGRPLESQ